MLLLKLCILLVITLRRKIGRVVISTLKLIDLLAKRRRKFRRKKRINMSRANNQLNLEKPIRVRFLRKKKLRRRKAKNKKTKLSAFLKKRRSQARRPAKRKYSLKSLFKKKLLLSSPKLKVLNHQQRKRNLKVSKLRRNRKWLRVVNKPSNHKRKNTRSKISKSQQTFLLKKRKSRSPKLKLRWLSPNRNRKSKKSR